MECRYLIFLLGIVLSIACSPLHSAWAHHENPSGNLIRPDGDFSIGGGVMLEAEEGASPKLLIAVSYNGISRKTGDHHVMYRYFWVSAQMTLATVPGDGGSVLNSLVLNIVPEMRITTSHQGYTWARRVFPIEFRHDVDQQIEASIAVQAVGWAWSTETPLIGKFDEHERARFTKFAQVMVDIAGLRLASMGAEQLFMGLQVGTLQARGGLAWNFHRSSSLRIAVGVRANGAVGVDTNSSAAMGLGEADFFARLDLWIKTAYVNLAIFLEGGYHAFKIFSAETAASHAAAHEEADEHDHHHPHGHPYILSGVAVSF